MDYNLKGRTAIIVGAGGGFGSAIAEHLAGKGVAVSLVGRSTRILEGLAEKITAAGGCASIASGDVRIKEDVAKVYGQTCTELGTPTILIDAAAVPGPFGPIGEFDPEDWWAAMTLHIKAPMLLMHQVLPGMLRVGKGHVIILSSLVGKMVYPHLSAYSVGKSAQVSLIAHAAAEHRNSGVSFFAIQPGFAKTMMTEKTLGSPEFQKWVPDAVQRINSLIIKTDNEKVFVACSERCLQLASGEYDALSGRFINPEENLQSLKAEVQVPTV